MNEWAVRCPSCRKRAVAAMRGSGTRGTYREAATRMVACRIVCPSCGLCRTSDHPDGLPIELWFKAPFRGHTLWFRSEGHGLALLEWIEGRRERKHVPWYEMAWREVLPPWMTRRLSRAAIARVLRDLLESR